MWFHMYDLKHVNHANVNIIKEMRSMTKEKQTAWEEISNDFNEFEDPKQEAAEALPKIKEFRKATEKEARTKLQHDEENAKVD